MPHTFLPPPQETLFPLQQSLQLGVDCPLKHTVPPGKHEVGGVVEGAGGGVVGCKERRIMKKICY